MAIWIFGINHKGICMRTRDELTMLQALPLDVKVLKTKQRIKEWVEEFGVDGVYVSRSGGKDSDVLGDIVKSMYPEIPHVFVNTGLEFDSVRKHAIDVCDEVLRPEMSFPQVITKYGYPIISKAIALKLYRIQCKPDSSYLQYFDGRTKGKSIYDASKYEFMLDAPFRISHMCCDVMKKNPAERYAELTGRKPIIGSMATESRLRTDNWLQHGCNAFEGNKPQSNPLSFWTEQDILRYIYEHKIEIAEAYGEVECKLRKRKVPGERCYQDVEIFNTTKADRTGCVFCMFNISRKSSKDRFLKLKNEDPKKYDYVMRGGRFDEKGMWVPYQGLGYKFVIDWLNEHGDIGLLY